MNEQEQDRAEITGQESGADAAGPPQEQKYEIEAKAAPAGVVLPARKYRLKMVLLFSDLWAAIILGYFCMIRNIVADVRAGEFSWVSLRMISTYVVIGITLTAILGGYVLKKTRSIRTRIDRDNDLRQDRNISVWLTTFDWTWLVLFVPTMAVAVLCGIIGYIIDWVDPANSMVHRILGGVCFGFLCLNAAVVVFKLTPTRVLLFVSAVVAFCLILLLMGVGVCLSFFEKFKYLGVRVDPLGYLLIAYVGFFFLRLIWITGLFEYVAMAPNRLDIQMGLSESERGIQRKDFRVSIDTEDVILRLFKVGRIIISFPQSDRLPMSYLVTGIDKKARYAVEAASVISVGERGAER
jgi:hypothetical protein